MKLNNILANGAVFGLLLVALTPLFITNSMFFPFITGKNFFFRIVVEIVFALWLILMIRDPDYRPKRTWLLYAYSALAIAITLATIFGANPSISFWSNYERMEGLLGHMHLFAYFITLGSILNTPARWMKFFGSMIGTSVIVVLYAAFQLAGYAVIQQGGVRIDGTLGNATYLAGYLLFHIFFLLYYMRGDSVRSISRFIVGGLALGGVYISYMFAGAPQKPVGAILLVFIAATLLAALLHFDKRSRAAWGISSTLLFVYISLIVASATRGAIIGLVGGSLVALFLLGMRSAGSLRKAALIGLIVAVFGSGSLFGLAQTEFGKSNPILHRFTTKALIDTFDTRTTIWGMALEGAKERPLLGWGPENFIIVFSKYYKSQLYGQEPWFDRAHNIFLDWLVGTGVVGLVAYLGLYATALYCLWKKTDISIIGKSLFTGLFVGHILQNFTVFDQITSYILFISLLSFVHSHIATRVSEESVQSGVPRAAPRRLPDWAEQTAAGVVVLLVITSLYMFNVRHVLASRQLVRAINTQKIDRENIDHFKKAIQYGGIGQTEAREHLLQFASQVVARADQFDSEFRNDFFVLARDEGAKEIERQPENARQILFLGSFLATAGQYADALQYLDRAHELSPNKQAILFERASVLIGLKRYDEVFATLKQAYELDPTYETARLLYIVGAIYSGKDEIVDELSGGKLPFDQRILSAFVNTGQFDKAANQLEFLVIDEPANPQAHVSLGIVYANIGRRNESIRELQKAAELNPALTAQVEDAVRQLRSGRNPFKQ